MKNNKRRFRKGKVAVVFAAALMFTSCHSVNQLSLKLGLGGSNPEEIVEITPSELATKPLRFGNLVISDGVSIGGVPVGGLTDVAAYQKLLRLTEKYKHEGSLELAYGANQADLTMKDLELQYDIEKPVKEAFKLKERSVVGEPATGEEKLSELVVELPKTYKQAKIDDAIKAISKGIYVEPVDDTIEVNDGKFTIKKGKPGKGVDSKKMKTEIESAMDRQYSGKIEGVEGELEQKRLKNPILHALRASSAPVPPITTRGMSRDRTMSSVQRHASTVLSYAPERRSRSTNSRISAVMSKPLSSTATAISSWASVVDSAKPQRQSFRLPFVPA